MSWFALVATLTLQYPSTPVSPPLYVDVPDYQANSPDQAEAYVLAGQTASISSAWPILSLTTEHDMLLKRSIITFHMSWWAGGQQLKTPRWQARRRAAHGRDVTTRYADGDNCPAILAVLTGAMALETPPLVLPGFGTPDEREYGPDLLHDYTYTLRAPGRWLNGSRAEFSVSGGGLSPVGLWAKRAEMDLEPCWTSETPAT